ncbi:prepilin peptidase [Sporosarcina thermotolerans]|uniref:Prepilin peptidase n=1 Tax=Sporosarcina thermotolerans TaxID=633404 RepID=A0AAW9A9J2_9BACL|nr:A24 family peptidase [Sporosarcina thermotolerans]MDW0118107.1 prepilin peptidase [Sporosarcina thermotolerans]WHT47599.1 prepilin peptidase [Sporosarcina thermotolerans]
MEIVWLALFFIYGCVFGSFFNVVGLRVPKKESVVRPPSHCTTCGRKLRLFDLIPVLSYVVLRGKCKGCGQKINAIYPFIELITGVLFAYAFFQLGFSKDLIIGILFVSLLVIITVSDISYMIIPDKVLLPFAISFLILRWLIPMSPWWDSFLGAAIGFSVLFIIAIVSKGGMGGGDIKLFFVIGLVLGTINTLLTLFLASIIGSIAGVFVLKKTGKGKKTPVPFGPSIALAAIISYFYGKDFVEWYQQLFF